MGKKFDAAKDCSQNCVPGVKSGTDPINDAEIGKYYCYLDTMSDTFDPAWADDDALYSPGNDGYGFDKDEYKNVNFNVIYGDDYTDLKGHSLRSDYFQLFGTTGVNGPDGRNWKSSGCLCLDGVLYLAIHRDYFPFYPGTAFGRPGQRQSVINCSIIKSKDKGRTWERPLEKNYDSPMFPGQQFSTPYFVYYGKDGAASIDNADKYVYAVSNNGWSDNGDFYILGRVLRTKIGGLDPRDWEFYVGAYDTEGTNGDGLYDYNWCPDPCQATPIISDHRKCSHAGMTYIPYLGRYILIAPGFPAGSILLANSETSEYNFWESPFPWGPWTKFKTIDTTPYGWYCPRILSKFQTGENGSEVRAVMYTSNSWRDYLNIQYKFSLLSLKLKTGKSKSYSVKINCGGNVIDLLSEDKPYDKNSWGYIGGIPCKTDNAIDSEFYPKIKENGYPDGFKSYREGNFKYKFDLPDGDYTIKLYFADPSNTGPGQREFNVYIQGQPILENFDIIKSTGGPNIVTSKIINDLHIDNGCLEIDFKGLIGKAIVNVIEVLSK